MGIGGLQVLAHIRCVEMATIPGAAEEGRQVAVSSLEGMEDGSELFRECEKPDVGGLLPIAQCIDEAAGGKARTGDAGGEPWLVDLSEEAGDLIPTSSLAGLAGIADEDDVEVEAVAGGIYQAVGPASDEVAEGGEKLEEQGGGMSFGVGRDGLDGESGESIECGLVELWMRGGAGIGRSRRLLSRGRRGW